MTAINDAIPGTDAQIQEPQPVPAAPIATPTTGGAPSHEPGDSIRAENGERITLKKLLAAMPVMQASDLHIKPLIPPTYRIGGHLHPVSAPPLTNEQTDAFVRAFLAMRSATRSLRIIMSSCSTPPLFARKKTMSCPSW